MKRSNVIKFIVPVLSGIVSGFVILHPISMFIVDFFEHTGFSISSLLARVQGGSFLPMGLYFSVLGGIIGLLFSIRIYKLNKTNAELIEIIDSIDKRKENIRKRTGSQIPMISSVVKEMRPTLNKIQNLVDLITFGNAGSINIRQSTLLSITKGNIDNLFYVIDHLLSMVENRVAEENRDNVEAGTRLS